MSKPGSARLPKFEINEETDDDEDDLSMCG